MPTVLAEVSDKIPGTGTFLVVCLVFLATVVGFAYQRWLWPMLLEFTIIGVGIFACVREFVLDTHMRQAILHEQGVHYFVVAFISLLVPVVAGVAVYVHRRGNAGQHSRATGVERQIQEQRQQAQQQAQQAQQTGGGK